MEAQWYADRTLLRTLLRSQPTWTLQDYADATQRSLGWVKKWVKRLQGALPDDDQALHSHSRARKHPPPSLSPLVVERILEIRDHPPEHLQRTPGPKAILYYLARDPNLHAEPGSACRTPRARSGRSSGTMGGSPPLGNAATPPSSVPPP